MKTSIHLRLLRVMIRSAFKRSQLFPILLVVIASAAPVAFGTALLWHSAFDPVNESLKLALIVLPAVAAVRSLQAKSGRTRFGTQWSVAFLGTTALIGVLSFSLDSSGQKRATQDAIDRQTAVITDLKKLVHPLDGALWASFSLTLDANQKALQALRDEQRARAFVNGKQKYGFVMLNMIDRADPNQKTISDFLDALVPMSWFLCSRNDCYLCNQGFNPDDPRGVELIAEIPQGEVSPLHVPSPNVVPPFSVLLDVAKQRFTVGVNSGTLRFRSMTTRWSNSDDLAGALVYFRGPGPWPALDYQFESNLTLFRSSDQRFLRVENLQRTKRCEGTPFEGFYFTGRLSNRWR